MKKKLLAVIMALAMMMSLMPATAFAADTSVSNGTDLQNALQTGGDVTLDASITGDFTVKSGTEATLDLNGHTLTNSTGDTITVEYGASLTITDGSKAKTGTVDNKSNGKAAIFNNGTVVLSGGTYDRTSETGENADISGGNSWYTICNHGDMTINGGVTVKNTGSYSSMIENGYQSYAGEDKHGQYAYNYKDGVNSANPTLTINGGSFTGGLNSVKNDDGGILTINGGTFRNTTQAAVLNWNKATINDGTFTVDAANRNCILNGASVTGSSAQDLGQLTITGGSFTSPAGVDSVYNNITDATPTITGGTFSSDVSAFGAAAGYKAVEKNGKYVVVTGTAAPVAKIGELGFNTLVNAVAAAQSGETIVLQGNASGAGIGTFRTATNGKGVKDFIIDFNTYTYTCTGPAVGSTGTESQAFHLEWTGDGSNNANVTLKNGTITSTANSGVRMLVQNYCNLTLDGITLDGSNMGTGDYALSNNCGNVTIKDATIIAPTGGVAFDACDYSSYTGVTVTVEGSSDIQGPVEVVNHNGGENNAHLVLKGGTFAKNTVGTDYSGSTAPLSRYLANGYELTGEGPWVVSAKAGMEAEATPSGSSVSASVTGTWTGNESQEDNNNVESTNSSIKIDVTTEHTGITSTAVTIDSATLESVQGATVSTVAIATNVGTLTVNKQAWSAITDNADGSSVTLSMEKDESNGLVYTLTAVDTDGNPVFAEGESKGSVTVTVKYPGTTAPTVYYLGASGPEKVDSTFVGGKLSWTVSHFSDYLIQGDDTVALVTTSSGTTEYNSLDAALEAATQTSGAVVNLAKNAAITQKVTIDKNLTINGNGNTITGVANDASVNFEVTNGTFAISNVTLDGFGSTAATNNGIAVIKVDSGKTGTKVVATNVNITNFCRSAYDIRSGSFEITGGTIDSGARATGTNSRLTKGIMAGYGSSQVTGTITGVTITNTDSNYSDWNSAGIEIYQNADVTVSGCTINNVQNGIHVDNYYTASSSTTANAVIQNTNITASNNAVIVFGKESSAPGTASVSVTGGTLSGEVKIQDGSKETVSLSGTTVNGDITNEGGSMGIVDSTITGTAPAADAAGVTYVNTTVNGTLTNTTPDAGAVALVGGKTYNTLTAAIAAAKSGDTITLLKSVESGSAIIIPAGVTLNGNGKAITCTSNIANGAFLTAGGANVVMQNLTINTNGHVKHGVQFYCVNGGKLSGVTVNGGYYTSVIINGATNIVLENCTLHPEAGAYANIEFAMGSSVTTIPSMTVNNVTFGSGAPAVWVDENTVSRIETVLGDTPTDQQILNKINSQITNKNSGDLTVTVRLEADEDPTTTVVDGTAPSGGGSSTPTYSTTVEKAENGTVTVSPQNASKGTAVTITVKPNEGFALDKLTVTDKDGKEIELTKKNDTQYTFTMPASKVTVKATFAAVSTLPFTDVDADDWYYEAVKYAYDNDLMNGMGNNRFAPNTTLSRGMIAQVLYNLEKNPAAGSGNFTDVTSGAWYADAVNWAAANSIVTGYGDGTFAPNKDITRQEMAAILYRYAQYKGYDTSAKGDLSVFTDGAKTGDWAKDAMVWAVGAGLLEGHAGAVNPTGTATRAEVATILMRFCENIAK